MPQLDAMLRALAERGARELRLADGTRPVFRFPDGDRPVSQTALTRAQITHLVAELAGPDASRVTAGEAVSFLYRLEGGPAFRCEIGNGDGPFAAVVRAEPAAQAATAAPAAAAPGGGTKAPRPPRPGAPEIEKYLMLLVDRGASDLHLCSGVVPMLRLDGDMLRIDGEPPLTAERARQLIEPIMPARNKDEFEATHDTDLAYEIPGVARFRVNVFTDRHGPGAVMRVIPSDILTVEDLDLSEAIIRLCHLHKGLVLVTGPTGSGKSTTLAAMVDYVNRNRTDHIITIEDPIEFVHPNRSCLLNQREVGTHTASFKKALRAALREDPDIVLVGEMRDLETVAIAIETAETGHLVFGTLHTTTAASTVDRIIDQFPADRQGQIRTMLSESLKGVISQTLLKKKGGGRIAAIETLIVTPAIANLIREGKTFQIPSSMQTGKKHGMVLLNEALLTLVQKDLATAEDAYAKAIDKAGFESALRSAKIQLRAAGTS